MRARTTYPANDTLPHHAPMLGVAQLPGVHHAGEVSGELHRGEQLVAGAPDAMGTSPDPREPVVESVLGQVMTAFSGGATGGLAAGSWEGAGIGAGVTTAAWSFFTLLNNWERTGPQTKAVLAIGVLLGGSSAAALMMRRSA